MHKAGVSSARPRPELGFANEDEREEFEEAVKKVGLRDEDATVATINQARRQLAQTATGRGSRLARGRQLAFRPLARE
jgi:hypothetical protein